MIKINDVEDLLKAGIVFILGAFIFAGLPILSPNTVEQFKSIGIVLILAAVLVGVVSIFNR